MAGVPPPRRRGIGGAGLRAVQRGELAAVYSRHRAATLQPSAERVLAHERVLAAIMQRGPVLPLRFGIAVEGEEDLAELLAERRSSLLSGLERVRGRVELGVRVLGGREERPRANGRSGRDYLLGRVAAHRRSARLARDVHLPLAELAVAGHTSERVTPPAILVGSYLVERADVERFREAANRLAAAQGDVQLVVTGPWAPYSFTADEAP